MPRIAAFDLDGTLTVTKSPMTATMGARVAALTRVLPVAIFSGAAFHQFERQFFPFLGADARLEQLYIFPTSAAQCYVFENGWHIRYENDFTPEEKQKIMRALTDGIEKTHVVDDKTPQWGPRIEDRGSQITFSALGQEAPPDAKKVWDQDKKKRTPLWQYLQETIPEFGSAMNAYTSVDITKKGINKAYGIRQLSEITGIAIPDMLYVGDALFPGGNDAIVKETGVPTREVTGPEETARVIDELIARAS